MSTATEPRATLEKVCAEQGLYLLGFTGLSYSEDYDRFKSWLQAKRHAGLSYLEDHARVRENPAELFGGARSAVLVAMPYFIDDKTPDPRVAQYARYPDYHRVLRAKAERAAAGVFAPGSFRVTVDSAPVLERALAAQTARGFIGKNTLFIHPDHGSFLLLGEILTTAELPKDVPPVIALDRKTREGGCGPCRQCQTACPTGALDTAYTLDAALCLSYWTIENRGTIPEKFWPWLAQYYFGCDLCQLACPYNLRAKKSPADWQPRALPAVERVAAMTQAEYEAWFGGLAITRAKRAGLRRNALIALCVTRHPGLQMALDRLATDSDSVLDATARQIAEYVPAL